jgi:hypothetical protein
MTFSGTNHDRVFRNTLIGAAILLLLGGGGFIVFRSVSASRTASAVDPWEQENYPRIIQLKSEGEALAIAGQLAEAHEKYRQIMLLVAGHRIKDPLLFDEVEQCKTDQDRIYAVILKTMEQGVAPAVPAGSAPAAQPEPAGYNALRAGATTQSAASPAPPPEAIAVVPPEASPDAAAKSPTSVPSSAAIVPGAKRKIPPPDGPTDQQVGDAIQKGVEFLLSNFEKDRIKRPAGVGDMTDTEYHGLNALCVFALLQCSQSIHDERLNVNGPRMRSYLDRMKKDSMGTDATTQAPVVYAKALRCAALAVYNRPEDRNALKADVKWLVNVQVGGAYTYDDRFNRQQMNQPQLEPIIDQEPNADSARLVFYHGRHNPDGSEAPVGDILPHPRNPKDPFFPQLPRPGVKSGMPPPGPTSPARPGIGLPESPARPPGLYPQQRASTQPNQPQPVSAVPWDNSNSQFGLLGVWSGAECGIEIPTQYWQQVQKHWTDCQLDSGEWSYDALRTTPGFGMTAGGLASLFVTHDYLDTPMYIGAGNTGRDPLTPALSKGLAHLEDGDNSIALVDGEIYYLGYNLFGMERVALASGYKYFGKHEWYRALTTRVLPLQWPNGSFGRADQGFDTLADTAFTLLFLARGRHPIFMNKLKFDGHWSNRPHDIANLTRFTRQETERQLNWQVVGIDRDWRDWADAPILYIASHEAPRVWTQDFDKLRAFALAGGLIFTHADSDSEAFSAFVETLAKRLFPEFAMKDVSPEDLLFTGQFKLKSPLPKLRGVHNGTRWLLVHSPKDLNTAWQTRSEKVERKNFELGVNLFAYATGMADLRNRLDSTYIPAPTDKPVAQIKLAQLQYAGNWDPEPFAWQRSARWLQWETDVALDIAPLKNEE